MNVLCLGSEVVGAELAVDLTRTFLDARFDGGERYVRRLEKIEEMERERHMAKSRLHAALRARPERLDRLSVARAAPERRARADDGRGRASSASRRTRRSSRRRSPRAIATTSSSARCSPRKTTRRRSSCGSPIAGHRGRLRPAAAGLGRRARARTATSRSRSTPTSPTTPTATIAEAQRLHELVDRPNLLVKIPATEARAAGDRGDDRPRAEHQRDADLLARAPRARSPRRTCAGSSGSSRRRRPVAGRARSRASSSRASTPRPTVGSTRPARPTS